MRIIDPRHLLQFHEIIRTGSFTRAATTLGLTQPALTRNMKLMEGRLGFELMIRSRQGIVPTSLGERILQEANAIVLADRRINALTDNLRRGYDAELRVACTPTLSLHAMPEPIASFARENPGVRLDIRQGHSGLLVEWLRDNIVDLVIGPPSICAGLPGSDWEPLFDSQMVILAARNHPLAGKGIITTEDLDHARWALHQPGTGIREAADQLLQQLGITDSIQANELPSNMILSLLRMGDHLAIVPRYIIAGSDSASDLVHIVSDSPPVALAHAAIWSNRADPDVAAARFVRHMKLALAPLGAA